MGAATGMPTEGDRGEAGNTALILETALLLGDWGHSAAYADAELMIRSHLLPSQLRDVSFIAQPANPQGRDRLSNVALRVQGAWGLPAPYGHQPFGESRLALGLDIVGTVVAALIEAYSRIVVRRDGRHVVNLLFDYDSDDFKVSSPYTGSSLFITVRSSDPVMVRIPAWVPPGSLELSGAARGSQELSNAYLHVAPSAPGSFAIRFPLPERTLDLSYGGTGLRARARGDQVIAMDNRGTDLNFFDPFPV
jgi:hypothetical protein